jgi:hypothetical protein
MEKESQGKFSDGTSYETAVQRLPPISIVNKKRRQFSAKILGFRYPMINAAHQHLESTSQVYSVDESEKLSPA